jgi:glucose-6-phosphate isomerase
METAAEIVTRQPLTDRPGWRALEAHYKKIQKVHLRDLFAKEHDRGKRLTATVPRK